MSANVIQVDGEKINEIVQQNGLSLIKASKKMGAGDSYLSGVIQSGRMAPSYLKLFCTVFNVDEADLISAPSKIFKGARNFVPIDSDKCKKLVYKNGYKYAEICDKLGYESSWLSNAFSRGTMHINALKRFAELMGVSWQSLKSKEIITESPNVEDQSNIPDTDEILSCHDIEYIKCIYNLATSIEAALTNFRQDLMKTIEEE